jgi:hypothetical protein
VRELNEAAGATLRYLLVYSPDLNPTEQASAKPKPIREKLWNASSAALNSVLNTLYRTSFNCSALGRSQESTSCARAFALFRRRARFAAAAIRGAAYPVPRRRGGVDPMALDARCAR